MTAKGQTVLGGAVEINKKLVRVLGLTRGGDIVRGSRVREV